MCCRGEPCVYSATDIRSHSCTNTGSNAISHLHTNSCPFDDAYRGTYSTNSSSYCDAYHHASHCACAQLRGILECMRSCYMQKDIHDLCVEAEQWD